jgi:hypothetical protein
MSSMSIETEQATRLHGGRLIARRLKAHGVTKLFTLSGGHIFSIYDGCREEGIEIVDTRHEQAATFAAEGWAKVTRTPGVAALTAGPGVTNGMSAIASAQQSASPILVLGGRAPAIRWGMGSLQEIDHVPFVAPLTKLAATAESPDAIPGLVDEALATAMAPHSGPTFLDFPMDHVFSEGEDTGIEGALHDVLAEPIAGGDLDRVIALLDAAERPVIMAGTNLYWGRGEHALRELAEARGIPVYLNGQARGCLPADHELFFSRARGDGLKGADLALVIGVPMDFRLGFGGSFGEATKLVVIDRAEPARAHPREVEASLYGGIDATLRALVGSGTPERTRDWVGHLRGKEIEKREAERIELDDGRGPRHRHLRAGLLARPGSVRLPRHRPGLRAGREARAPRPPGRPARRRRRLRLQRDGVRHARAPRRQHRRGDGQQRHLGAGEAPDGVLVRVLGRGRAAAGDALRPDGRGARRPRRARPDARGPQAGARAGLRGGPSGARQRAHGPRRGLPAQVEPGMTPLKSR